MGKFYISAGHGGADPGAVYLNRWEKDYNLKIANEIARLLKSKGHEVKQNRTSDIDSPIDDKVEEVNGYKPDLFLEVHLNATKGGTGTEVYHSRLDNKGYKIANKISKEVSALFKWKNRGAKTKTYVENGQTLDYFGVIRRTLCTSLLMECCFIDSDSDMKALDVSKISQSIANTLEDFFPLNSKIINSEYIIKSGDSFYSIAREMLNDGNRYEEIASFNGMKSTDVIHAGQKLNIPTQKLFVQITKKYEVERVNASSYKLKGLTDLIDKGDVKYV